MIPTIRIVWRSLPCSLGARLLARRQSTSAQALSENACDPQAFKFTSFFWRNDQWSSFKPSSKRRMQALSRPTPFQETALEEPPAVLSSPLVSPYPPPLSATRYRPVPPLTLPRVLKIYAELSKSRLSFLMVLTTMTSVALSPLATTVPVLLATAAGTYLCSASANTLNQLQEVPYDAQMARTRNRPLVRRAISPLHATCFAVATGIAGPALLLTCVNSTTALLGLGTILLYAGPYTYLKRRSIINTWVGSVVGAIPPLMGLTACGGHLLPSSSYPVNYFLPPFLSSGVSQLPVEMADSPLAALALFGVLFSWQFPHFNSLSFLVRASYAQAGYHMLSVFNPPQNALVSLRHALLLIPICSVLVPLSGLTTWTFAFTGLVPNIIVARYAWAFWKRGGEKEARKLFFSSLWYLPVVMGLMMVHKNGLDWGSWLRSKEPENESSSTK